MSINIDILESSEFERAAQLLFSAKGLLKSENASSGRSNEYAPSLTMLSQRSIRLEELLINKIRPCISSMLTKSNTLNSVFPSQGFIHCVRALLILQKHEIIEQIIAESVVVPLIKTVMTQGRVDGTGGRGSYAGLQSCFQEVLSELKTILFIPLTITEKLFDSGINSSLDLIINSIWKPISSHLVERFPGMFTIAIPNTFSVCYLAYNDFKQSLTQLAGIEYIERISKRIQSNELLTEFELRWNIEMYFHLRTQEIFQRSDKLYDGIINNDITFNVFESIYGSIPSGRGNWNIQEIQELLNIELESSITIQNSNSNIKSATGSGKHINLPLIKSILAELIMSYQGRIMLEPLRSKFLTLALRLLVRLEGQICLLTDITTTTFPKTVLVTMTQQLLTVDEPQIATISATTVGNSTFNSPSKKINNTVTATQIAATTQSPNAPTQTTRKAIKTLSMDEIILLVADLYQLIHLLPNIFRNFGNNESLYEIITTCLTKQSEKLENLRVLLWNKSINLLSNDCKRNLAGVKVIAGKYRMTNKPPPDSASSYVETILQPLK